MRQYDLVSKNKLKEILLNQGLWMKPGLHSHINKVVEEALNKTAIKLAVNMLKSKRKKVVNSDFDYAYAQYRESYVENMLDDLCDRIYNELDKFKKEVKHYYGESPPSVPDSTEQTRLPCESTV